MEAGIFVFRKLAGGFGAFIKCQSTEHVGG